ncbi:universal stress protein [Candidatus Nitrospira nitrificans]|uniref:Putative Universal stress protein n=1 Tax=Candidatus Nitrospira nitrificans TaxID=1742973 RepID=A0A0S4LMK0_9BACT|nr:universal stress protein [Candidatus Nitrospira nitrificans]CUS37236.1 putative Universal stress protein [Candidatus Nitrospira nitrificans]
MKILLAVDGSDNSYEAVRALKYLARAEKLHIVHILDVPSPAYPMMMPEVAQELYETVERNMRDDGTRLLDRIVSLLPLDAGPVMKHLVVGSPVDQIVALAEQQKINLILLGARGLGPVKERLVGSVSHRVLTFGPGAKLILPGPLKALHHILLPLQGSYDADHALSFLQQKPFRHPPTITLFTVLPHTRPPWPVDAVSAEHMETHSLGKAKDFLEDIAAKLKAYGYQTRVATTLGTPVEAILQEAKTLNPDLILAGSRGRRGITRMVLGSVSHALLHQGTYPLMIFG